MSSINFNSLVQNLLFEAPVPAIQWLGAKNGPNKWVYDLLDEHERLIPGSVSQITDLGQKLDQCIKQATLQPIRPSQNSVRSVLPLQRIYDIFVTLNRPHNERNVNDFLGNTTIQSEGDKIVNQTIKGYTDESQWILQDSQVKKSYDDLMDASNLTAKAALETYYNKSIIDGINEIIKKRTDVLSRVMALRNPFGAPFQNLVKDVMLNPEQYASGNKKVTGDFKNIVDNLYFNQLLQVGVAAKEFYSSLPISQTSGGTTEYQNILFNKGGNYSIGDINSMKTEESIALITALRNIAEYERSKAGRGETVGKIASALGSLRVGMGPVG